MGDQERLLRRAIERVGADGPRAAARSLHQDSAFEERLGGYLRGDHEPKLGDVMLILSGAGLLQPEAIAAWEDVSLGEAAKRVSAARLKATAAEGRLAERKVDELSARAGPRRARRRSA